MTFNRKETTKTGTLPGWAGRAVIFALVLLLHVAGSRSFAQKPQITILGGWMLNGSVDGAYGELDMPDDVAWGGALTFPVQSGMSVEFSYIRQETEVRYLPYTLAEPQTTLSTASVQYFMLGGIAEKGHSTEKVRPFGLFQGGVFVLTPDNNLYDSVTKFALAFGGGLNIDLSEKIGLRMQGRLLMPMWFDSGYIYAGSGGAGVGVSAGIPLVQGDFLGGLTFKF
jgi:hypothetical protein